MEVFFRLDTKDTSGNEIYLQGNTDGTLTWDGGAVDSISGSGSNWIRYASGMQVCWGTTSATTSSSKTSVIAVNSTVYWESVYYTFPVSFSETPALSLSVTETTGGIFNVQNFGITSSGVSFCCYGPAANAACTVYFTAIGRWK